MIDGKSYTFDEEGILLDKYDKWENSGKGKKYKYAEGNYATGYINIGGYYYYFDDEGIMQTGYQKINGKPYKFYIDPGYGYSAGWTTIKDGKKVYCLGEGKLATGYINIGGHYYDFDEDGIMQTGYQKINGKPYKFYIDPGYGYSAGWTTIKDGKKVYCLGEGKLTTGYINIGGYYYYFDDEGIMQTGYQKINGKPYKFYMDPGYGYSEGWTTIKDGDKVYCWGNGKLATGRVAIKGKIYTFDEDGVLLDKYDKWENSEKGKKYKYADGSYAIGYVNIGGYYYYFNDDGVMQTGYQKINGKPYKFYMDPGYGYSVGWTTIKDGKKAYCLGNGKLATGYINIGGYYYYFDEDGIMQTGYQKINGKPYKFYIDPGYGYSAGWTTIKDGDKAYCLGNGRLVTGKVAIDGKTYTFDEEGILKDVEDFYKISGNSSIDSKDLMQLYNKKSKVYPNYYKNTDAPDLATFCKMYVEEARLESIKPEVAFCQAMLETGWLQYSGSVKIQQFNFAGLGATGGGSSGASFPDVRTGIRAQIQHLKAYASTDVLVNSCVDPRFNLVKRGSALYVEWLGQRENPNGLGWATSPNYGYNILTLIEDLDR